MTKARSTPDTPNVADIVAQVVRAEFLAERPIAPRDALPCNPDAEQVVVAHVLGGGATPPGITEETFYVKLHAAVFTLAVVARDQGHHLETDAIIRLLGRQGYVSRLLRHDVEEIVLGAPFFANVEREAEKLLRLEKHRRLIGIYQRRVAELYRGDTPDERLDAALAAVGGET